MIMLLLDNKILLYSIIGLLFGLLLFLISVIIRDNKKNKTKDNPYNLVEIDSPMDEDTDASKVDIEQMLEQMKQDIDVKDIDDVKKFEDEQEEKSIISYKELLEANQHEVSVEKEIDKTDKKPEKKLEENLSKKFKNTEFISPIYGRQDSKAEYPTIPSFRAKEEKREEEDIEEKEIPNYYDEFEVRTNDINTTLEETLNIKPLSDEIKKNDDFLNMLKEFRKNLE